MVIVKKRFSIVFQEDARKKIGKLKETSIISKKSLYSFWKNKKIFFFYDI